MPKKKLGKTAAALCVGADRLELRIRQLRQGHTEPLDCLIYPLELEREIRETGRLSPETVRELTGVLQGFQDVLKEYGVEQYRAVYTRPVQQAENCAYVFGQLRSRTGMEIQPLWDSEERAVMAWNLLRQLPPLPEEGRGQNGLLVLMGENALALSAMAGKEPRLSRGVPLTLHSLKRLRFAAEEAVEEFGDVVAEYLRSVLTEEVLGSGSVEYGYVAAYGQEAAEVARLAGGTKLSGALAVEAEAVRQLTAAAANLPPEKLAQRWKLPQRQVPGVYAAAMVLDCLLRRTGADQLLAVDGGLTDGVLELLLQPKGRASLNEHIQQAALGSARELYHRFQCDERHAEQVCMLSCCLFDKLKRIHGLSGRWRLYLQIACLLHDCGIFVGEKGQAASRALLAALPLYGLSQEERQLAAGILDPENGHLPVDRVRALFLLADALDVSRLQKFAAPAVKLDGEKLVLTVTSDENTYLERTAFAEAAGFFELVYGLRPVLQVRSTLL